MHLVEIFLPSLDNEGNAFPNESFNIVRLELMERFGGVTIFARAPGQGITTEHGTDDIIVIEVMTPLIERFWWDQYRRSLEQRFKQDEVLIRGTEIIKL